MPCLVKISPVVFREKAFNTVDNNDEDKQQRNFNQKSSPAFGSGELKSTIFMEYKITIDLLSIIGIENETSNLATSTTCIKKRLD